MKPVNGQSGSDSPIPRCSRKWLSVIVTIAVATAVTTAFGQAWVIAKVSFYMGEVGFRKADSEEWSGIALGQPLFTGDAVRTDVESRLEVKMGEEGVLVRIEHRARDLIAQPAGVERTGNEGKSEKRPSLVERSEAGRRQGEPDYRNPDCTRCCAWNRLPL